MKKVVVALLLAGIALIAVELSLGALSEPKPALANPCRPRDGRTGGFDATVQRIVLDGLDGAACRLHTSREELVLSIGGGSEAPRHWDEHTIEVALRAGMLHAVDEAEHRGDVPGFLAPALRGLVRRLPLEQLIRGGISLGDVLG